MILSPLHVVARLDRYGGAATLRQLLAGGPPLSKAMVAALTVDSCLQCEVAQNGVEVTRLLRRWPWDVAAAWRLRRLLAARPATPLHAWGETALAYALAGVAAGPDRRLTATLRSVRPLASWPRAVVRHAVPRVEAWVVEHHLGRQALIAQGVDSERIVLIPPGVNEPQAPPPLSRMEARMLCGAVGEAPLIVIAERLVRRRELDEAIWAFELVRVLHPQARLAILGDGPDRPRLERFAALVSEPGCVRLLGLRSDAVALLGHADVCWQLSPRTSIPRTLLEAMAAGVPTVAAASHLTHELIGHGERALAVDRRNRADVARATDALLTDRALAQRLAAAGRAWVVGNAGLEAKRQAYAKLFDGTKGAS